MSRVAKLTKLAMATPLGSSQLERFVAAMKALDDLKRNGRLDALTAAFARQ